MAAKSSFEKDMSRLDEIVRLLEKGEVPLDESLALFEEGTALVKKCGEKLDSAERKIKLLTASDDGPQISDACIDAEEAGK